jgi:hypothetical protein
LGTLVSSLSLSFLLPRRKRSEAVYMMDIALFPCQLYRTWTYSFLAITQLLHETHMYHVFEVFFSCICGLGWYQDMDWKKGSFFLFSLNARGALALE